MLKYLEKSHPNDRFFPENSVMDAIAILLHGVDIPANRSHLSCFVIKRNF